MTGEEEPIGRELARLLRRRWPAGYLARLHVVVPLVVASTLVAIVAGLVMPDERAFEAVDDIHLPADLARELEALDAEYRAQWETEPEVVDDPTEQAQVEAAFYEERQARQAQIEAEALRAATEAGLRRCESGSGEIGLLFLFDVACEGDDVRSGRSSWVAVTAVCGVAFALAMWVFSLLRARALVPRVMTRNRLLPPLLVAVLLLGLPPAVYWSVLVARDADYVIPAKPVAMDAAGCLGYSLAALALVVNLVLVFDVSVAALVRRLYIIFGYCFLAGLALALLGRFGVATGLLELVTETPYLVAGIVVLIGAVVATATWRSSYRMAVIIFAVDLALPAAHRRVGRPRVASADVAGPDPGDRPAGRPDGSVGDLDTVAAGARARPAAAVVGRLRATRSRSRRRRGRRWRRRG